MSASLPDSDIRDQTRDVLASSWPESARAARPVVAPLEAAVLADALLEPWFSCLRSRAGACGMRRRGTVRFREPVVDAVKRVADRELGVTASVGPLLGYIEYPSQQRIRLTSRTRICGGSPELKSAVRRPTA